MEYSIRLIMVLSGSVAFLTWEIMNRLLGNKMKARWKRNLLLIPLFFYLFPLAYYKSHIVDFYHMLGLFQCWGRVQQLEGKLDKTFSVVFRNGSVMLSKPMKTLIILEIIAFSCSLIILIFKMKKYRNVQKNIMSEESGIITDGEQKILQQIKEEIKLKTNVKCIKICKDESPFASGIRKKIIAMPVEEKLKESNWCSILRHELAHIKHGDMWWGALAVVVVAVHWYNPLNYYYVYKLLCVNEEYADEFAVSNMNRGEKVEYCKLLIDLSEKNSEISVLKIGFGKNSKNNIKKRIELIMRKGKSYMIVAMVIGMLMIMAGTFSVFAYEVPLETKDVESNFPIETEEEFIIGEIEVEKIPYDDYFIDEFGREYSIEVQDTMAHCNHSYVKGIRKFHSKKGVGCRIDYYNAKRCKKCGYIVEESFNHTETWEKCPH